MGKYILSEKTKQQLKENDTINIITLPSSFFYRKKKVYSELKKKMEDIFGISVVSFDCVNPFVLNMEILTKKEYLRMPKLRHKSISDPSVIVVLDDFLKVTDKITIGIVNKLLQEKESDDTRFTGLLLASNVKKWGKNFD